MKNALLFVAAAAILCLHSGCFEIHEKLKLNADGSGHYTIKVISGPSLSMADQFGRNMEAGMESDDDDYEPVDRNYDSTFYFRDYPAEAKANWKHPEIMSKAYIVKHVNDDKLEFWHEAHLNFDDPSEIELFLEDYREEAPSGADFMSDDDDDGDSYSHLEALLWFNRKFTLEGNRLSRAGEDLSEFRKLTVRNQKMQLALAKKIDLYYTVELPGKIKSSSNSDFETKGKKATLGTSLDEILEEEVSFGTVFEFK